MKYEIPSLIIGCSIESLLYAWKTQTKIVVKTPEYVFRHDRRFKDLNLSFMNAANPKELYNNLVFSLSVTSLLLCPDNVVSIREDGDGINIVTKGNRKLTVYPDELTRFDEKLETFNVYDFFDTREMSANDTSMLTDPDEDFIYQLNRYKTPRVEHNRTKDLVGASRMTLEQLLSPDYGQGIAMLKILRMLKSAGINGKFAWQRKDKRYYKRPKIEFFKRVTSQVLKPIYSLEEIFNMKQMEEKPWKTLEMLRKRVET